LHVGITRAEIALEMAIGAGVVAAVEAVTLSGLAVFADAAFDAGSIVGACAGECEAWLMLCQSIGMIG
jgi:hypothetical protein